MDSDDQLSKDLLAAFKARFGLDDRPSKAAPDTGVLKSAEFIYNNAIDVSLSMAGTKQAGDEIARRMEERSFSTTTWSSHKLHPRIGEVGNEEDVLNFVFTMDLLNFCFWGDDESRKFTIDYQDQQWTGYWALVAALRRALDQGVPITSCDYWQSDDECTLETLRDVFRGSNGSEIPLLEQRLAVLKEAGDVLYKEFDCKVVNCIKHADHSAPALVNLLVDKFPSFRDIFTFEGETVRFFKRAQIFVADVWACFEKTGLGDFADIEKITAFADYRIPQMLHTLGCISYSPPLDSRIKQRIPIESGHNWEVELRGCSVWAVELIRRQIQQRFPEVGVNSVLIDFFLYDTVKELEAQAEDVEMIPHHRTRSIWY